MQKKEGIIMELTIDPKVVALIKKKRMPGDRMYLDFEDGDGPFANTGLSCRLDLSFRFIITPESYPATGLAVYNDSVETAVGPVRLKQSSEVYLDAKTRLVLGATGALQLKGASGILADNIPILRIEQQTAGERKLSGGPC